MSAAAPNPHARKVIITCAITGGVHVPSMTPHLPLTPEQIAESAIGAAEAGAAIVHLHARNPQNGAPSADPDVYAEFIPEIASHCDAVINITTGGGHGMSLDERTAAARRFKPELCSMNMGSMNFGMFPAARRIESYQYDWEQPYLEMTKDYIFRNTFKDIETLLRELGSDGTRFEFECYDVGHLHNLAYFLDQGLVKPPLFVQCVYGTLGGIGASPEHVMHMKATADKLFGDQYQMSMLAAGRKQMELITFGAIIGTNVRVGLEDSIFLGRGELAESNAAQVAKIARILRELSFEIATPDEAREMLALKGAGQTAVAATS